MADAEFDWNDPELVRVAPDVCIYTNQQGEVLLRQRAPNVAFEQQEDALIFLPVDSMPRLVAAAVQMLKEVRHQTVTVLQPGAGSKETETVLRVPVL